MMDAPRRALSGLVLVFAIVRPALAQDPAAAKPIQAEIKKVEEKIKEESERVSRKKQNLQVEFAALQRDETRASLQAKLAEIGARHKAALKPAGGSRPAESQPAAVPDAVRTAILEETRAALAATVGRNLSTVLDTQLSSNLIDLLREEGPVDYQVLLKDTVDLFFDGADFEANYGKQLAPIFEKKLAELQAELAGHKQRLADLDVEARGRAMGVPAGMVLVPGGKYRIGSDTKEFDDIRKRLRFGEKEAQVDKYALGWPAHEVEIEDFFIDINEVTNRHWAEFVRDTGRKAPKHWEKKDAAIALPNGHAATPMENLPITFITFDDALLYCEWSGRRLPTEFEWEAAARYKPPGDRAFRWWPWGDVYDLTKPFCNNQTAATHPLRRGPQQLTPVGTFPEGKSALGIHDLAGNALEMTSSYFTAYPGWDESKVPSKRDGKDAFSGSLLVLRGGSALASEIYSLTTTRKAVDPTRSAEFIGFRTALSKTRGKDFVHSIAGGNQLASQLEAAGPALKDEKSGRAELAIHDPSRYTALMAGGWDPERHLPSRARYIAVACRNTMEFTDLANLKSMARERKKPVMLAYFRSEVDFIKPVEIPKGSYWIMWDPGRVKGTGKDKVATPEGIVFQSMSNPENFHEMPKINPVLVARSSEPTKLVSEKDGSVLSMIMSFPVRDRKEARFIVDIRLETAPEALKPYK